MSTICLTRKYALDTGFHCPALSNVYTSQHLLQSWYRKELAERINLSVVCPPHIFGNPICGKTKFKLKTNIPGDEVKCRDE